MLNSFLNSQSTLICIFDETLSLGKIMTIFQNRVLRLLTSNSLFLSSLFIFSLILPLQPFYLNLKGTEAWISRSILHLQPPPRSSQRPLVRDVKTITLGSTRNGQVNKSALNPGILTSVCEKGEFLSIIRNYEPN